MYCSTTRPMKATSTSPVRVCPHRSLRHPPSPCPRPPAPTRFHAACTRIRICPGVPAEAASFPTCAPAPAARVLIHTQRHGSGRRLQVQAHDLVDLLLELRVLAVQPSPHVIGMQVIVTSVRYTLDRLTGPSTRPPRPPEQGTAGAQADIRGIEGARPPTHLEEVDHSTARRQAGRQVACGTAKHQARPRRQRRQRATCWRAAHVGSSSARFTRTLLPVYAGLNRRCSTTGTPTDAAPTRGAYRVASYQEKDPQALKGTAIPAIDPLQPGPPIYTERRRTLRRLTTQPIPSVAGAATTPRTRSGWLASDEIGPGDTATGLLQAKSLDCLLQPGFKLRLDRRLCAFGHLP